MPLGKQHVELIPRLDTKRDPRTAPLGTARVVQNAFRVKSGEYRRRTGRTALSSAGLPGGTLPDVWQLAEYKGDLFALSKVGTSEMIWGYDVNADRWIQPGTSNGIATNNRAIRTQQRGAWGSTVRTVHAGETTNASPDIAIIQASSNYALVAFQDTASVGNVVELIYDMVSGEVLARNVFPGFNPHVEGSGAGGVLLYTDETYSFVKARYWTAAAVLTGAPASLTSHPVSQPGNPANRLDTCLYGGSTVLVATLTVTPDVNVVKFNLSTGLFESDVSVAVNASFTLGWLKDSGGSTRFYLATASPTAVEVRVLNASLSVTATYTISTLADPFTTTSFFNNRGDIAQTLPASTTGPRNITGYTIDSDTSGHFVVIWDVPDGLAAASTAPHNMKSRYNTRNVSGVVGTAVDWIRGVGLRSKVFQEVGSLNHFCMVSYGSQLQPSYFLMQVPTDFLTALPKNRAPVLKVDMWRGNGQTEIPAGLTNVVARTTTTWDLAVTRQLSVRAKANAGLTAPERVTTAGIDIVEMEVNPATRGRSVEFSDNLLINAGQVMSFDGIRLAELGFPIFPEMQATPTAPSNLAAVLGGNLNASSVYQYAIVYRHTDALGRVHRSAPGVPASTVLTTATFKAVNVEIPYLRLWGRDELLAGTPGDNMMIEIYRTTGNGSTFYLLAEIDNTMEGDSTTYTDTAADTALVSGSAATGALGAALAAVFKSLATSARGGGGTLLYTNGAVIENDAPPQFRAMVAHRGRVFGINADDPMEVWFSKPTELGLGPEFSRLLTFRVDDAFADCTALASMDDKLVIFKAEAVYVMNGDGPDNLARGPYQPPQRIAAGVGTVHPRSVFTTPDGVPFQSPKGIWLVQRGLTVIDFGAPVDGLRNWPTTNVVDVVHVANENHTRFYMSDGSTLIWDYFHQEWYFWTNQTTVAAVRAGSSVYQVKPAATAIVTGDDSTVFTDEGVGTYRMQITTTWIALGGISGFQRLYELELLGEFVGAHFAICDVSYDYSDTVTESRSISVTAAPWRFSFKPARQKCSAITIAVYDGTSGAGGFITTGGFRFSGLGATVGIKGALDKMPSASRLT